MGLLDKLKDKSRGILTAAKPAEGVDPAPVEEVRRRLLDISGKGMEAIEDDGQIIVAWSAKVASAGVSSGSYEYLYRAIRITLDPDDHEATGLCYKTTTEGELTWDGSLSGSKNWERGQHVGTETLHVLAWLGPHHTEGGADERGYRFSWSSLREPVVEAVTGSGWTYKPKRV